MKFRRSTIILRMTVAALLSLSAAISATAQDKKTTARQNEGARTSTSAASTNVSSEAAEPVRYIYEFKQPQFIIFHILIEHDAAGHGKITFERRDGLEPITDPIELSDAARTRILSLWNALNFLDSIENYQSDKKFPHLGTMHLGMERGELKRDAEFNWTNDASAKALVAEYKHLAEQAIFIFDITLARENQPLEAPKLLDNLDSLFARGELSDPQQLVPLLRDLTTDERIPLIARNHAARILKKITK